jgi:hypothetical protein
MTKYLTFLFLLALLGAQACKNSHEPAPPFTCNPSSPTTYTADVKPIMDASCVSGCHEYGGSYSSVPLTSYADVKSAAENKNLLKVINHESAYSAMPKNQAKLSQEILDKIACWANNGYKN